MAEIAFALMPGKNRADSSLSSEIGSIPTEMAGILRSVFRRFGSTAGRSEPAYNTRFSDFLA